MHRCGNAGWEADRETHKHCLETRKAKKKKKKKKKKKMGPETDGSMICCLWVA